MKISSIILAIVVYASASVASNDDLKKAILAAEAGCKVQAERLKVVSENIANQSSVSNKPGEDPYRRKLLFVKNEYDKKSKTHLVKVFKRDFDKSPFEMRYDPYHPAADKNGYVKMPNIQIPIETTDKLEADISYKANLKMMSQAYDLVEKTIEAMR